ncbi:MAG: hypothetical protein AAB300_04855, partial [Nitrospirota bacterium]
VETEMLAPALRKVLENWGAGSRKAPELQSIDASKTTLADSTLHADLVALYRSPLSSTTNHPMLHIAFDFSLFRSLRSLSKGLFHGNTNATYPMKAVLLVIGLMPAFDSQVRCGLQRGGFIGMDKTQYLLPESALQADGKKIAGLPFLLGECWATYAKQFHAGITNSKQGELITEHGRVFDVLLFRQGNPSNPVIVKYQGTRNWYDLPRASL